MAKRVCIKCGRIFTATGKRKDTAMYCSNECRKTQVKKKCAVCGKEFSVKLSHSGFTECCSFHCRNSMLRRRRQAEIEQKFNKPIFALLYDMYCIQGLGIKQIAKRLGVSDRKLWEWFVDLGIERRGHSDAVTLQWVSNDKRREHQSRRMKQKYESGEYDRYKIVEICKTEYARKKNSDSKFGSKNWMYGRGGSRNPNWKGGKLYYYGPSWYACRNNARKRDNYTCQHCGITERELGKQLDVHHIVKFRTFGVANHIEANRAENLVSLCPACHVIMEQESAVSYSTID